MNAKDLHMHSNMSNDGDYSPGDLMRLCAEANLRTVALTDHNSVRGVEEAMRCARKYGMDFITGVELDCRHEETDLHVLGYGIDIAAGDFEAVGSAIERQERADSPRRIELIKELGIFVDDAQAEKLAYNGVVTGEMIAEIALKDERNFENPLLKPYYPGGSRSDNPYVNFYWDYCSKGSHAYTPIDLISLREAVDLIRGAGGVPVLAHPGKNIGRNEKLLCEIIEFGILGIEVYSSYHDDGMTEYYRRQADSRHLLKTPGSDFHGKTKPSVKLGSVYTEDCEQSINALQEYCRRGTN